MDQFGPHRLAEMRSATVGPFDGAEGQPLPTTTPGAVAAACKQATPTDLPDLPLELQPGLEYDQ